MSEIMKKPKGLKSPTSYFTGTQVLSRFYNQSGLIPEELKEKKLVVLDNLLYIEEVNNQVSMVDEYIKDRY